MINRFERDLYQPAPSDSVFLPLGNEFRIHAAMTEFSTADPWSKCSMGAVIRKGFEGWFDGQSVLELGIGDARQSRIAAGISAQRGIPIREIVGIDIDPKKLALSIENLENDSSARSLLQADNVTLYHGDVVQFLTKWHIFQKKPFDGRALICLPQTQGIGTSSDVVNDDPSHDAYKEWDKWGLSLNAGALHKLGQVSTPEAQSLLVLSGRIPEEIHDEFIGKMGWRKIGIANQARVQQDHDTPLEWMKNLPDDEKRFYDRNGKSMSISKAVDTKSRGIPIYHDVFIYQLQKTS